MKVRILTGLLVAAASSALFAQSRFQPGYIVPLAGDTVRGSIDDRGERQAGLLCHFRPASSQEVADYQPEQLKGYGFADGRDYQSRQLPGATAKPAFVRLLVAGKASLYHTINGADKDCYYLAPGATAPLQALVQQDTTQTPGGAPQVRTSAYRHVLWSAMADCPSVQAKLVHLDLREKALVQLFSSYNICSGGAEPQYVSKNKAARKDFMILGGVQQGRITFQDEIALSSTMQPIAGVGVVLRPGRFNPHFALLIQALYRQQSFSAEYYRVGGGIYTSDLVHHTVDASFHSAVLPVLLRYSFLNKRVHPYLQLGVAPVLHLQREASMHMDHPRFNLDETEQLELRPFNAALILGTGLSIDTKAGSIQLEARADALDGNSKFRTGNVLNKNSTISFLVGYTFGK